MNKYYSLNHLNRISKNEWIILNNHYKKQKIRSKRASVLSYFKKYINSSTSDYFIKSISEFHSMYNRNKRISKNSFISIINELKALGLLKVTKVNNINAYSLPNQEELEVKINEFSNSTSFDVDNLTTNSNFNNNRCDSKEEFDSIINKLLKGYKGISHKLIATKNQLYKYAKSLFAAKGLSLKNSKDRAIQMQVFNKIKHSKQNIRLVGAIAYINTMIEEKINLYSSNNDKNNSDVPYTRFNDFSNQRQYDYDELELKLLGWE